MNMILLAISNTQLVLLIVVLVIAAIGTAIGVIQYAKIKVEREIEAIEASDEEPNEEVLKQEPIMNPLEEVLATEEDFQQEEEETKESLSEIELLLEQMQTDLEKPMEKNAVDTFEQEQEEKSIISYQELKAAASKTGGTGERKQETTAQDIVLKMKEELQQEDSVLDPIYQETELEEANSTHGTKKSTTFSTSEFISPVYGRMDNTVEYPTIPNFKEEFNIKHEGSQLEFDDVKVNLKSDAQQDLEKTFDLGPLTEEIKKNDEFLKALKDFRNNLE